MSRAADTSAASGGFELRICTKRAKFVSYRGMERLNVTLDDEQADKLVHLADRLRVPPGTIARSLLSTAIDDADPDARTVVELLDGIPGALARAQRGLRHSATGETLPLDEL